MTVKKTGKKRGKYKTRKVRAREAAEKTPSGPPPSPIHRLDQSHIGAPLGSPAAQEDHFPKDPEAAARAASSGKEDQPPTMTVDAVAGMIGICNVMVAASVKMQAARKGLEWTPELEELSKLNGTERSTLGIFAPMAAPYFEKAIANSPYIGAVGFGFVFLLVLTDRNKAISAMAKAKEPVQEEPKPKPNAKPKGPAKEPTDKDKAEHADLWGLAADAVPVGFVPHDTGQFGPKWSPAA